MTRLVITVCRFGDEVRADLQERYGVNLADQWRSRRWRHLLVLIDQLPATSRLSRALLLDDEYADALVEAREETDEPQSDWSPDLTEWSLTNQLLMQMSDQLQMVTAAIIGTAGGKPPKLRPAPRPKTAIELAEERRVKETHDELLAVFTPGLLTE